MTRPREEWRVDEWKTWCPETSVAIHVRDGELYVQGSGYYPDVIPLDVVADVLRRHGYEVCKK